MSLDQETIARQLDLLTTHRRTLAHLLQQAAQFSAGYVPAHIANGIAEARAEIRRIKAALREGGVQVEDDLNDDARPSVDVPRSHLTPQEQRNRSRMLDKVELFWVKGVLEQSLYQIAHLELGFEQAPAQVRQPWETVLHQTNQPNQTILAGKPIIAVFDDLLGEMLILGAPGAGKTTTLLELTRDLITRARQNEQHQIPVVFNLSTWATNRQPLKEWLVGELNQRYDVPKTLAQEFVNKNTILPMLDGLDEVAAEHRTACAEAINEYRKTYSFAPLAVCSRIADYEALSTKLRLQSAVVIQPLTKPQADDYLKRVGRPLAAVRAALRDDATLWELMDNPLMLSIVALAYKDKSAAKLRASGTAEERRQQLFDDYITAMFARPGRSTETSYTRRKTIHSLSWLAGKIAEQKQTVLYIERMQPDWLQPEQQRRYRIYARILGGLVGGLFGGLVVVLVYGLLYGLVGLSGGQVFLLFFLLIYGVGGGLVGGLVGYSKTIESVEVLRWKWSRNILFVGLVYGLYGVLGGGLVYGLYGVLYGGLVVGLVGERSNGRPVDGLSGGLGDPRPVGGLVGGLYGLLVGLLVGGLVGGLSSDELETKAVPNQGIRRSVQSALVGVLVVVLVFLLVGVLVVRLVYRDALIFGLVNGLAYGLPSGLIVGLNYGGFAVIRHYTLRWMLYRNGSLPLHLVPFLDYCAERVFLRKVGGGYIFIHRLLMEHFASLYTQQK